MNKTIKNKELAERLVYQRKLKGLSQEQLAMQTRITVRTIQRLEKGQVTPHLRTVKLLAAALDVEVGDILQLDNPSNEECHTKWLLLLHSSPFIGFVVPLLNILLPLFIWVHKRDDHPLYDIHGRAVINFQITMTLVFGLALVALLSIEDFGFLFFIAVIPFTALVMLGNIIALLKEHKYYYPISISFIGKRQPPMSDDDIEKC